jgi:hypothetical protein
MILLVGTLAGDGDWALMAEDHPLLTEVLDTLPLLTLEGVSVLAKAMEQRWLVDDACRRRNAEDASGKI